MLFLERDLPISAVTVQGYAYQIMNCIAFIHNRGVLHRGIKVRFGFGSISYFESTAIQMPANSGYSSNLPRIQGDNAAFSIIAKLLVSCNKEQTSKESLPLLTDLCRGG